MVLTLLLLAPAVGGAVKGALPFAAIIGTYNVGKEKKVVRGVPFGFTFCLSSLTTTIDGFEMTLALPPQVAYLDGVTTWSGDLDPGQEGCIEVDLSSRTEMTQWAQPIHARMEFIHQGIGFTREVKWSHQGWIDTQFVQKTK